MSKPGNTGIRRLAMALVYSWKGFLAAWRNEEAFRQETIGCLLLVPLAVWLGDNGGTGAAGDDRAAGAAGGTDEFRHRGRGGPVRRHQAHPERKGQGYGVRRRIHVPGDPGDGVGIGVDLTVRRRQSRMPYPRSNRKRLAPNSTTMNVTAIAKDNPRPISDIPIKP